jgi:nitrate reductase gamma subunit
MSLQVANSTDANFGLRFKSYFKRLAFQHKKAEAVLYLMFFSGLLLWPFITVPWPVERTVLLLHMLAGISVFPILVGSFWLSHRRLIQNSNKKFLRQTGSLIEYLLIVCTLSGVFLTFWGNTGNDFSVLVQDIHFYSSWLLTPLVLRHAWRWTVIKFFRKH